MEFDHSFSVAAPIDVVWAAMTDIGRIAPCVPNARVTGRAGADSYDVEVTFAVGPLETTAERTVTLTERDDTGHHEVLTVVNKDSDVDTPADATITIVLTQAADRTAGRAAAQLLRVLLDHIRIGDQLHPVLAGRGDIERAAPVAVALHLRARLAGQPIQLLV